MKKQINILLLLIFIVSSNGFGQKDSAKIVLNKGWIEIPSGTVTGSTKGFSDSGFVSTTAIHWYKSKFDSLMNVEKRDTINSLLIVVDTGYATTNEVSADSLLNGKAYYLPLSKPSPYAYYLNGYDVRKQSDLFYLFDGQNPIMEHEKYLDADKNILPKNIIVIQSISKQK